MLGLIFEKAQSKIQDPAKLRRLIVDLIGAEEKTPDELTAACACNAHEELFSSRRGVYYLKDADVVVLYDNNPNSTRPAALERFQKHLQWQGLSVLAQGTWPDDGYAVALLVDATRPDVDRIATAWQRAVMDAPDGH